MLRAAEQGPKKDNVCSLRVVGEQVLSVQSIGNLNSTLPLSYYHRVGNIGSFQARQLGLHDLWGHFMLPFEGKGPRSVDIRSKYLEEQSVTLAKNENFFARALPLLICVL